jgi:UDP-glucose 4-epimerase
VDSRAINIGTSRETDVLQLAGLLAEAAGVSAAVQHAPARPGEQRRSAVRTTKAERVLGWHPQVSLAEGLKATFDWFAERRDEVRA